MSDPRCKCTMPISLTGDGCRYCQPQEHIDRMGEWLDEEREEVTRLQAENDALREQLKRQAKAAQTGMDAAKQAGESMYRHGEKMLSESNPEALESERSANALLTEENEALRERLENYEALKRMHRLDNYPNELSAKAWLLRKQAEAVEAATNEHEIKSATDDSKCYSVALLGYAKRLRQQADEIEND